MVFLLLFCLGIDFIWAASDFENARVIGSPRLSCSKKSLSLFFETNIPFQGRISIIKKMYIPECNQDYATNIMRNATFKMDIGRCTETTYMTNGSRVLMAHVEIGFHPLVITSSDRVYALQCIDNSYAIVRSARENTSANCSHVVRTAAKWEGLTVFHVGDPVVHEWSCAFDAQDNGNIQMFLTSCNAISQAGQLIHLVDENGCVVDSELMGDLVYNNYTPKIYARAKVFKLMNGEKYRVECNLQMCRRGGECQNRPFPPKCAFTKDEIISRYETKLKNNDDALMTGAANPRFDRQVKVTSEWITVHYNQYTNVEQLHERYFINALMDPDMTEEVATTTSAHFLMGISYRDPNKKSSSSSEKITDRSVVSAPFRTSFKPEVSPTISSSEEDMIEMISEGLVTSLPVEQVQKVMNNNFEASPVTVGTILTSTQGTRSTTRLTVPRPISSAAPTPPSTRPSVRPTIRPTTARMTLKTTTESQTTMTSPFLTSPFEGRTMFKMDSPEETSLKPKKKTTSTSMINITTITTSVKVPKGPIKGSVATMRFYTDRATTTTTVPTTEMPTTMETPFDENNSIFNSPPSKSMPTATEKPVVNGKTRDFKDNFANPRDWRLDDRTINDTDAFSDKQIACNTTTSTTSTRCIWTGIDHLLIVWSFGSALVWLVMLAVCFYRNSYRKPTWIAYRERELKRANRARILPQEHPWLHADAFEEPKLRKKHEIDMNKY